jgi:hypothetical protein
VSKKLLPFSGLVGVLVEGGRVNCSGNVGAKDGASVRSEGGM